MSTKTQTATTHYHIQKKRRAEFLEEWRKYRHHVIRKEDVALVPTARGLRTGVYMGWDGDRPTRCLDALVHEIDPGTTSTIHRHSWDAILFMVEGSGWTDVDGVRYDWKPWDAFHIPAWSWHRHGNDGDRPGRFMSYSSEPTLWTLGMSLIEDAGHEPHAHGEHHGHHSHTTRVCSPSTRTTDTTRRFPERRSRWTTISMAARSMRRTATSGIRASPDRARVSSRHSASSGPLACTVPIDPA